MTLLVIDSHICEDSNNLIVCLPGRGQKPGDFSSWFSFHYYNPTLEHYYGKTTSIVEIHPENEWYPAPNGSQNQEDAVVGMKKSIKLLHQNICTLSRKHDIPTRNISLLGFSAGGVMALQIVTNYKDLFNSVICHSGAVFESETLPESNNNTPILLSHRRGDDCFTWNERYLPMKNSLIEKRYRCDCYEIDGEGHGYASADIILMQSFMMRFDLEPTSYGFLDTI